MDRNVIIEYACGHTEQRWCYKPLAEIPAYVEKQKLQPCKFCKERRKRAKERLAKRESLHRFRVLELQLIAHCIRAAGVAKLTPTEQRYVRRWVSWLDRLDAERKGTKESI